ncbi:hypothetical protein AVEN_92934-1 [Araneus ventricosus]|uniref:Uncharacterized protein n=1 Tax=Araneus ventricosus TaxID=182803 RepID=A0A4Y2D2D4_ARAVE|nr:hypothetical protein AVEN_92934-1 [Araneus ventricosus]
MYLTHCVIYFTTRPIHPQSHAITSHKCSGQIGADIDRPSQSAGPSIMLAREDKTCQANSSPKTIRHRRALQTRDNLSCGSCIMLGGGQTSCKRLTFARDDVRTRRQWSGGEQWDEGQHSTSIKGFHLASTGGRDSSPIGNSAVHFGSQRLVLERS